VYGNAVLALTMDGLVPVATLGSTPRSKKRLEGLTEALRPQLRLELEAAPTAAWRTSETDDLLLVHRPDGSAYALAENGWSTLGIEAAHAAAVGGKAYILRQDGRAVRWHGDGDLKRPIATSLIGGPSAMGTLNRKSYKRIRATMQAPMPYNARIDLLMNQGNPPRMLDAAYVASVHWSWDEAREERTWQREQTWALQDWRGVAGLGTTASVQMATKSLAPLTLTGFDVMFEQSRGV
jgi:hypothetical protein